VSYIFADLGLLDAFPTNNEAGLYLEAEYKNIDTNHDGTVSEGEFVKFWRKLSRAQRTLLFKTEAPRVEASMNR
jgi:hypothetical protein